jgi:2-keto-4-pentenoate hydratase
MDRHHDAARLLLSARRDLTQRLNSLPEVMRPQTEEQAYLVQRAVMAELGGIGGWKVGSPRPDGPVNCSPLPATGIQDSPAQVSGSDRVVEAEIAVRIGRDLPPQDAPYSRDDILAAIASAHPAIEVLQSRYVDANAVDPLSALADSLSHFGLVVGAPIPNWQALDLRAEQVRLIIGGAEIKRGTGNPAGGMIRLVLWLANEGAHWAGGLRAGQVVTTGSWTGKDPVPPGGEAQIVFDRAGESAVRFAA